MISEESQDKMLKSGCEAVKVIRCEGCGKKEVIQLTQGANERANHMLSSYSCDPLVPAAWIDWFHYKFCTLICALKYMSRRRQVYGGYGWIGSLALDCEEFLESVKGDEEVEESKEFYLKHKDK